MYKSEASRHPWRQVREKAAYKRTYRNIGRDIKIGQMWVMLASAIIIGTTLVGTILSTTLYSSPFHGELSGLGKMLVDLNQRQAVLACMVAIVQCIFLYIGSKNMYRLIVLQMVPIALLGLAAAGYMFTMPDTRALSVVAVVVLSPYLLCAGIFTLSWRAKLYLDYMNRNF